MNYKKRLEQDIVMASVPCRLDLGGTLDISSFYLYLNGVEPSSFNIALDLRTHVSLSPFKDGVIKISSAGFESAEFKRGEASFHHPMGLMFAVAEYFNAHGIHIRINSTSPPRSALGGSSSAAVAMISAFYKALDKKRDPEEISWLAHYIEASVAGVPCGIQDQLAAAYGGVNQFFWKMGRTSPSFERKSLFKKDTGLDAFNDNILVAYCGIPHVSKDINKQWVETFLNGETRDTFAGIARVTNKFSMEVMAGNYRQAGVLMNQETGLRLKMTPEVLDNTGKKLFEGAVKCDCGARFTGAGGGGCLWAVGETGDVERLRPLWEEILAPVRGAEILDTRIEKAGIL